MVDGLLGVRFLLVWLEVIVCLYCRRCGWFCFGYFFFGFFIVCGCFFVFLVF